MAPAALLVTNTMLPFSPLPSFLRPLLNAAMHPTLASALHLPSPPLKCPAASLAKPSCSD